MSLVQFQRSHSRSSQDPPYSRTSYSEDYDPTFDPNFDEDTVYDGLPPTKSVRPAIDRAPAQNHRTQRSDLPWRILTTRKCLVSPLNCIPHQRCSSNDEVNTLRAWVIGLFWAIVLPGVNQFFFFRYPTVTVGGVCRITRRVGVH